ncbi:hypothetical protein H7J51_20180 [Mycobacterium crocinum]|uniref:DUF222 domain-containing protein n=1 Tax=Mycolicibacterium crocinum TaxID=388459 RepID=A0ABY3TT27_9MYCO|nr:hypothetical protein [Mycolicibacterium crocinum]MCV7217598.1 hypothetical protein [Mycolicibacterium crocinum]ULN42474.1 hypothetical protein MI149_04965 [Mycolicibacterium crocinum]
MTGDAQVLLGRAEALLNAPDSAAAGNAARLAAFLARQAVEDLIDARCAALCEAPADSGTTKAKLAILKSMDTTRAGPVLIAAWHQLTGHCHQHAYQLSPTVSEVREQCLAVRQHCLGQQSEPAE